MIRALLGGIAAFASATVLGTYHMIPGACLLLTAKDATTLAGVTVTRSSSSTDESFSCVYTGAGGPASNGVEITTRTYSDAAAAHTAFPRWVMPYSGATSPPVPGMTLTAVANMGDEATLKQSPVAGGIYFRRGLVLVKIGTHPPASDAALTVAAKAVIGRL